MSALGYIKKLFSKPEAQAQGQQIPEPVARYLNYGTPDVERRFWNGEKNWGELGTIYQYTADYYSLAARCWQAYTESAAAKLIINDFCDWVIGNGLRVEAQPNLQVLQSEGVNVTEQRISELAELIEYRFNLHAQSRYSSNSRTESLHSSAYNALKTAALSGDCLVIQRVYKSGGLAVEVVDGMRIIQPMLNSKWHKDAQRRGNKILNGIEMNSRGGHVAYFVRTSMLESKNPLGYEVQRVPAKGSKTGRTQAFMVYHSKYRVGHNRGIPMLSAVLELLGKLDRYIESAVGAAEERAKIVYFIKHELGSTGENPLLQNVKSAISVAGNGAKNQDENLGITTDDSSWIATTSGKQTYNLEPGSTLESIESKTEDQFEDFTRASLDLILSSVGAPPEVFRKQYNSNYSASRMAVKTWENKINIERYSFAFQYYKPFYSQFLELDILAGKVSAPGYLNALLITDNKMVLEAYRKCRFVGANVPAVDPKKEADAARVRLGKSAENVPLSTPEQETENVGSGEFSENKRKFQSQIQDFEVEPKGGQQ